MSEKRVLSFAAWKGVVSTAMPLGATQLPALHTVVALQATAASVQLVVHFSSASRNTSQPSLGLGCMLLLQSAYSGAQAGTQALPMHSVLLTPFKLQALLQEPQLATVVISASQPSLAVATLQSPRPALHDSTQAPAAQVADAALSSEQFVPHAPQLSTPLSIGVPTRKSTQSFTPVQVVSPLSSQLPPPIAPRPPEPPIAPRPPVPPRPPDSTSPPSPPSPPSPASELPPVAEPPV